jgi:hypothetical protein
MFKKLWFGHLYLGATLALPLLVMAASGIMLSFYDELRYAAPPYRLAAPVHQPLHAHALAETVRRHFPGHRLEVLFLPRAPEHSARAKLAGPEPILVFIHPGTTAILATQNSSQLDELEWLRELHRGSLFGLPGKIFASVAGLGILLLWLMGLYLWFRRNKAAKRQGRRKGRVKIHRLTGLLLGGPIAGLASLGALLNFAGPLMQRLDPPPTLTFSHSTEEQTAKPLSSLVDTLAKSYRAAPLERVYFPATPNELWRFRFMDGSWGFMNGHDGTLIKLKTPYSHWTMLLYPLHSGKLMGVYSHWVSAFGGLGLLFLIGSGLRQGWSIIKLQHRNLSRLALSSQRK